MNVLLDHCIPQRLRHEFPDDYTVETASYRGWHDLDDTELLKQAESEFDAFVTLDRGFPEQQNLQRWDIRIMILSIKPAVLPNLIDCISYLVDALEEEAHEKGPVIVKSDRFNIS